MRTRAPYELFRVDGSPFWYVYFLDRSGRRVRKSTKESVKERAHAVARELERIHGDPTYQASHSTTLGDAGKHLEEFLETQGKAFETRKFYGVKLRHLYRVLDKDLPLAKVTAGLVDDYTRTRLKEGAKRYTVSKELTALRMLLKVARRRGTFDREVSQVLPVGFRTGYKPRTRRLSMEDAWRLIHELPGACARYAAFVCGTTARDAAVHRAVGADLVGDKVKVKDLKTAASSRWVPLTVVTRPFIAYAFDGIGPGAAVAPGISSVRHAFERAAKKLGLAHVSPNDLRRSVAHWFLEAGVPRDVVAAFMGHGSTKMLDAVYGKLDPVEVGAAIGRALAVSTDR